MNRTTVLLAALASCNLSACALQIESPGARRAEAVGVLLYTIDNAQTINVARRPDCFVEVGWPTREIIGSHPTSTEVSAWLAVETAGHYMVSSWLDRQVSDTDSDTWRRVRFAWHAITLGAAAYAVVHNIEQGLRPFGSGVSNGCEARGVRP